jgi:hypothetical protein
MRRRAVWQKCTNLSENPIVALSYHEDGDGSLIRNVGKFPPDCTVLHYIRLCNQEYKVPVNSNFINFDAYHKHFSYIFLLRTNEARSIR